MKKICNIVSMAILLFCTAACSDSYLELSPESSVSDEVIFENADAAQYAFGCGIQNPSLNRSDFG